jgi:hypothetical protein
MNVDCWPATEKRGSSLLSVEKVIFHWPVTHQSVNTFIAIIKDYQGQIILQGNPSIMATVIIFRIKG